RDYASPWINVQSWQNTLNMCFALLNYPGRLNSYHHPVPGSRFQNTKNENIEVGITLFVLYQKRKEDIDLPTGEQLIIIGINLVRLAFFDRFFYIDRALVSF
ncbi:unnamed protein product, partial [Brassica rapa subsp. trilocularis]